MLSATPPEIQTPEQIDAIAAPAKAIPNVISENATAALNTEPIPSKKIIGRSGFKLPTMEEVSSGSYVPPVVIKEKEVLPTEVYQDSDFTIYWNECIQRLKNRNFISLNSLL